MALTRRPRPLAACWLPRLLGEPGESFRKSVRRRGVKPALDPEELTCSPSAAVARTIC